LPSAVVYGANSSGKSNLLKSLAAMRNVLLQSVKLNDGENLDYSPFLLAENSATEPTYFEIEFLIDEKKLRYGYEYNKHRIVSEWLYETTAKAGRPLFVRTEEGIGVATNHGYNSFTLKMLQHKLEGFDQAVGLFQILQLGFEDIIISGGSASSDILRESAAIYRLRELPDDTTDDKQMKLKTIHYKYDKEGNRIDKVSFDKIKNESEATHDTNLLSADLFRRDLV
jgi:hypothetical protein